MPASPQHTLPQQFGRLMGAGLLTFTITLWFTASIFISAAAGHRNGQVLRWLVKELTTRPFATWLSDFHHVYLPFFLAQRALVGAYLISAALAWATAFLYDIKILRKENIV